MTVSICHSSLVFQYLVQKKERSKHGSFPNSYLDIDRLRDIVGNLDGFLPSLHVAVQSSFSFLSWLVGVLLLTKQTIAFQKCCSLEFRKFSRTFWRLVVLSLAFSGSLGLGVGLMTHWRLSDTYSVRWLCLLNPWQTITMSCWASWHDSNINK